MEGDGRVRRVEHMFLTTFDRWAELDQCEMTAICKKLGYNSLQYVTRTNIEFQAIG